MKHFSKQKGVSLYIAIMIIAILLAIVLGAGAILLGQLKIIKGMENSIAAFYAADSGIEEVLMSREDPSSLCAELNPCVLGNGAEYYIEVGIGGAPGCSADNFCIRSVGSYRGTKRAIEVVY